MIGPGRGELDGQRQHQQQRRDQQQDQRRQHDVADALDQAVGATERRLADRDDRHAEHGAAMALDQVGEEHVGHEIDRRGGVLEVVEQLQDARLRGHRQRQVDHLHLLRLGDRGEVVELAQQLVLRPHAQALLVAAVDEADQFDARVVTLADALGQRHALVRSCRR